MREIKSALHIECPNILSSMYAQRKLKEEFDFNILTQDGKPHYSDRFCVVAPPPKYKNDKPVICYCKPTYDIDGNETYDKTQEWISMFEALKLINFIERF